MREMCRERSCGGLIRKRPGKVIDFKKMIKSGSLKDLEKKPDEIPGIILGSILAKQIGAYPGSLITVISPEGKLTPFGRSPNTKRFIVCGIFDSGYV